MKYQFMPMFWGDFLANTMHLTAQEAGAYLFLIGHAWEHDGKIAVKDLQRVARITNPHWHKVRPRLEQFFTTMKEVDYWFHERVHVELTKAAEISNKRKEAGLASAQQMHNKRLALVPPSTSTTTYTNASLGKGSEAPQAKPVLSRQGPSPDLGLDYRSPPRPEAATGNVLVPLPDKGVNR